MAQPLLIQRLSTFLLLLSMLVSGAQAANAGKPVSTAPSSGQMPKSPDQRYLVGRSCLRNDDTPCAQVALAGINPASPYAKLLDAQLAAARGDLDMALRQLIPLQAETGLLPQAVASLHATLALAYAGQDNVLRAVEQRTQAEPFLDSPEEIKQNQTQLWTLLSSQTRDALVEIRGQSPDPVVQGWLDLAIAYSSIDQRSHMLEQWRMAYPDHPISEELLLSITTNQPINTNSVNIGQVALLLPLDAPEYAAAAQAVLAGFKTAHAVLGFQANIQIYPTNGTAESIVSVYQHALLDGAQFVVGPLVRGEVAALATSGQITLPTLALNQPEGNTVLPEHLLAHGMAVESEARQVAQVTRHAGLQSITVLSSNTALATRMAKAFGDEWRILDGGSLREVKLPDDAHLEEFKAQMNAQATDGIFLATDIIDARRIRTALDPATPTYATSHIYDGDASGEQNQALNAIHFIDMPWLLDPGNGEYAPYRRNADEFGKGWPQRWFALGADAYKLLPFVSGKAERGKQLLQGLSGKISLGEDGRFTREMETGQFRTEGVVPENQVP